MSATRTGQNAFGRAVTIGARRLIVCEACGRERPHQARGLCAGCYFRQRRTVVRDDVPSIALLRRLVAQDEAAHRARTGRRTS